MPVTTQFLKSIVSEARPIIERQMEDAKRIAGFRTVVSNAGGDWGALKALIKAQVEDENDETGAGKRVQKIRDKADCTSAYADMLGLANMNEKNFSSGKSYAETKGKETTTPKPSNSKVSSAETGDLVTAPPGVFISAFSVVPAGEITEQPETANETQESPSNRDASADRKACQDDAPQGNRPDKMTDHGTPPASDNGELAADEGRSEGEAASAVLPTFPPSPVAAQVQQAKADDVPPPSVVGTHSEDDDFDPSKLTFLKSEQRRSIADYRPHCQHPEECGSSDPFDHCHRCKKDLEAAPETEAA